MNGSAHHDTDEITRARMIADEAAELAGTLKARGRTAAADAAYLLAAELELADPELQMGWGGPLNGQEFRRKIFLELFSKLPIEALVETGTFRGISTEWFAEHFDKPILSCEIDKRYYLQAIDRLEKFENVEVTLADSTEFIRQLKSRYDSDAVLLFYLDAHWLERLPLAQEVAIVQRQFPKSIVMIDDFELPLDPGYAFDNYGIGKRVSLSLLSDFREKASFFFPSMPSSEETGAKRGTCALAWDPQIVEQLSGLDTLRPVEAGEWDAAEMAARADALVDDRILESVAQRLGARLAQAMGSLSLARQGDEAGNGASAELNEMAEALAPFWDRFVGREVETSAALQRAQYEVEVSTREAERSAGEIAALERQLEQERRVLRETLDAKARSAEDLRVLGAEVAQLRDEHATMVRAVRKSGWIKLGAALGLCKIRRKKVFAK